VGLISLAVSNDDWRQQIVTPLVPNAASSCRFWLMSQCIAQYVFKPNPGADMSKVIAQVKVAAEIWKRHGADVSFWTVSAGEIGNHVFACRFESFEAYGKIYDAVTIDPAFLVLSAESAASGLTAWVRSNLARAVALD
jgi:hypothetical protein